jgi:hypothetical protein
MLTIKSWFYVASNRTAFVAFLTAAVTELGAVLDHSISPLAALVPVAYGVIHLIFPDFSLTASQLGTLQTIAVGAQAAPGKTVVAPVTTPVSPALTPSP